MKSYCPELEFEREKTKRVAALAVALTAVAPHGQRIEGSYDGKSPRDKVLEMLSNELNKTYTPSQNI